MKLAVIGLGRMGANIARNLKDRGHEVLVYNRSFDKSRQLMSEGFEGYQTIEDLTKALPSPAVYWVMVPSGSPVDEILSQLRPLLKKGDIVIDAGNSNYKDTKRRYSELKSIGVSFADAGTSGGTSGARNGACVMFGGDRETFDTLAPMLKDITVDGGFIYAGEAGAGHYVKMVHNGIEYGMMQAIGEGFEILSRTEYDLNLEEIAGVWNNGSIIAGYLMSLAQKVFSDEENFASISDYVDSSGEGLWTVEEALRLKVSAPVLTESLLTRFDSVSSDRVGKRVVSALRQQFGDHPVKLKD
ncbi:MAG: decarboxylating 6-phosphogluconate dehydrogenase [Spirochaetales bacterium]|nr:decarboxylating 6-phosphogluconate dehydrogenase [Spirochaetales bacterium]